MVHRNLGYLNAHTPYTWLFDNETDRNNVASSTPCFNDTYIYKLCYQKDNQLSYLLTSISPIVWTVFGSNVGVEYQNNITDDTTENIIIGDITLHRAVYIKYTLEDTVNYQSGKISIVHNGSTVTLDNYFFGEADVIDGITFSSDISGDDIRLNITAASVGNDLKFRYKIDYITISI